MAITTLDGVIAGMRPPEEIMKVGTTFEAAGVLHSFFYAPGRPGAAISPTPGLSGASLNAYSGQIPFTNPVSGNTNLARFQASSSIAGNVILMDRLWHNSGIVISTVGSQTVNSIAFPVRDNVGSSDGAGVMVALEVSLATTNAGAIANTTILYTNSDGTSGRTGTLSSFPATSVLGTFVPFSLQAGDTGVRSIQSITLGTTYVAGTIHLVAYRTLARLELPTANTGNALDAISGGFVRLYDNSVPFLVFLPTTTTAAVISGTLIVTQG